MRLRRRRKSQSKSNLSIMNFWMVWEALVRYLYISSISLNNSLKLMLTKVMRMLLQIGLDGIKTPLSKLFLLVIASYQYSSFSLDSYCLSVGSREEKLTLFQVPPSEDTLDLWCLCSLSFQSTTSWLNLISQGKWAHLKKLSINNSLNFYSMD